jgi:hypothetical protein
MAARDPNSKYQKQNGRISLPNKRNEKPRIPNLKRNNIAKNSSNLSAFTENS